MTDEEAWKYISDLTREEKLLLLEMLEKLEGEVYGQH